MDGAEGVPADGTGGAGFLAGAGGTPAQPASPSMLHRLNIAVVLEIMCVFYTAYRSGFIQLPVRGHTHHDAQPQ